ncbi:MAG: hypothetical protein Q3972_06735 [Corynebacterium sp.]|nr:hypothetical protein [Corynebacterium sp.]
MSTSTLPIVIAVSEENLQAELQHIIAATGRDVMMMAPAPDLGMNLRQAHAVMLDSPCAAMIGAEEIHRLTEIHRLIIVAPDIGPYEDYGLESYRIPAEATRLLESLVSRRGEGRRHTIGIFGAVGGAGCSTFAAALALSIKKHHPILIDGAKRSGGLDLLLGMEDKPGARWQDLSFNRGRLDPGELASALPQRNNLRLLTHSRGILSGEALPLATAIATLSHTGRPLIIDMGSENPQNLGLLDFIVMVVPLEVRAVASAHQMVTMMRAQHHEPLLVGVNRTWSGLCLEDLNQACNVDALGQYSYYAKIAKGCEMLGLIDTRLPRSYRQLLEVIGEEAGYG